MDSFEEDDQVEESTPRDNEAPTLQLEHALSDLGRGGSWLRGLFLLGSIPGVLNALHLVAYVFLAWQPRFLCKQNAQKNSNLELSVLNGSSCSYTEWNSEVVLNFSIAPQHCDSFVFLEPVQGSTIVSEWSLVCDDEVWRPMSQVALGIGKIIGSLVFGCISDRMGRKTSFLAASFVYLVAGPAAAFAYHYPIFLFFRVALGAAGAGAFSSAYTIMAESAYAPRRPTLAVLFNLSYPIGFLAAPVLSLIFPGWRPFQLAISLPALLLVLPCWSLPESPRWLISQGRHREALHVVRHATTDNIDRQRSISSTENRFQQQDEVSCWSGTKTFLARLAGLLRDAMFRKRLLLSQLTWFSCSLTYHTLMLSGASLGQEPHRYVVLLASIEILAYLLPLPLLKKWSRRICLAILLCCSTGALATLLLIPQNFTVAILAAAMASRFFISAAYSVITLFTSELFPTVTRNTALGTCTTFAQIGSISAPFLVEMTDVGASIPTWVCFGTSFAAVIFSLGLPAVQSISLCDTMAQARARSSEAELKEVSFFRRKAAAGDDDIEQDVANELSDIPEEETSLDLSHLGLG
ncbi:organic cation transporter protein-like [Neocloeon triangulifer]|uniref:organic cation transporter protein-like n=1 Tax=Neocloeon triangulifer TaxID=2078957 RepID=UPI00286F98D2|nr:organic cation transporter protein-like [Neocloeon triangulifer]